MDSAFTMSFDEIDVGATAQQEYRITESVYTGFSRLFGDFNPLHMDVSYARQYGFDGCVMHGAILNGFLSQFVGMVFPGRNAMLLGVDIRYHRPVYLDDALTLKATVVQKSEAARAVVIEFVFQKSEDAVNASGVAKVFVRA